VRYAALLLLAAGLACTPRYESVSGFAICDVRVGPIAFVRVDALLPDDSSVTVARTEEGWWILVRPDAPGILGHEVQHVLDMRAHPDCLIWAAWHSANRRRTEARAYCAAARVDARTRRFGEDPMLALRYWARAHGARYNLTLERALVEVGKDCDLT
jgi:hypothetical protein